LTREARLSTTPRMVLLRSTEGTVVSIFITLE